MKDIDKLKLNEMLEMLNGTLLLHNSPAMKLIVCGGSALIATGLYPRTTADVDIVARLNDADEICDPEPMPAYLIEAANITAKAFNLPDNWLNCGPVDLFRMGLPEKLKERLEIHVVGEKLTIYYVSRIDQIYFKLYAATDRQGYHITDLLALKPTAEELYAAALWTMTHDVSDGYKEMLKLLLKQIGFEDVSNKL